jgi:nucleoid DNA-binding protein
MRSSHAAEAAALSRAYNRQERARAAEHRRHEARMAQIDRDFALAVRQARFLRDQPSAELDGTKIRVKLNSDDYYVTTWGELVRSGEFNETEIAALKSQLPSGVAAQRNGQIQTHPTLAALRFWQAHRPQPPKTDRAAAGGRNRCAVRTAASHRRLEVFSDKGLSECQAGAVRCREAADRTGAALMTVTRATLTDAALLRVRRTPARSQVQSMVDQCIDLICETLILGERIGISRFGSLTPIVRKPTVARATPGRGGGGVKVPARRGISFTSSRQLRDAVAAGNRGREG